MPRPRQGLGARILAPCLDLLSLPSPGFATAASNGALVFTSRVSRGAFKPYACSSSWDGALVPGDVAGPRILGEVRSMEAPSETLSAGAIVKLVRACPVNSLSSTHALSVAVYVGSVLMPRTVSGEPGSGIASAPFDARLTICGGECSPPVAPRQNFEATLRRFSRLAPSLAGETESQSSILRGPASHPAHCSEDSRVPTRLSDCLWPVAGFTVPRRCSSLSSSEDDSAPPQRATTHKCIGTGMLALELPNESTTTSDGSREEGKSIAKFCSAKLFRARENSSGPSSVFMLWPASTLHMTLHATLH